MADLRTDTAGMSELLGHLVEREGSVDHFYCDHRGLVTIAIGILIDKDGAPDTVGKQLAQTLASRSDVKFVTATGAAASPADVQADWQRVKDHGRQNPGIGARRYGAVARLRVDRASVDAITGTKLRTFLDDLYAKRPFILSHDVHVAMALIDTRYNPAGVALYGSDPRLQQMWNALDASQAQYNPGRAVQLFEQIWAGRGNDRYQQRHRDRVEWMRAGLRSAPATPAAPAPPATPAPQTV
jgi:hypothetical protein